MNRLRRTKVENERKNVNQKIDNLMQSWVLGDRANSLSLGAV